MFEEKHRTRFRPTEDALVFGAGTGVASCSSRQTVADGDREPSIRTFQDVLAEGSLPG